MHNAVILHPTQATPVPVTLIAPRKSGKAKQVKKSRDMSREDLAELVKALGLKVTTKHTKPELREMLTTRKQVAAAAYVREQAARKAKRAAAKKAA